jgi:hypothetical protein
MIYPLSKRKKSSPLQLEEMILPEGSKSYKISVEVVEVVQIVQEV